MYKLKIVLYTIHVVDMVTVRIIWSMNGSVLASFGGMEHIVTNVSLKINLEILLLKLILIFIQIELYFTL